MNGLYVSQFLFRVGPRLKWYWRPNIIVANVQYYSSASGPDEISRQIESPEPSYKFEDGFLSNISRSLNPRKKANLEKLAKYLCETSDLHNNKIKERLLVYIATNRSPTVPSSLFLINPNVATTIFKILKPYFRRFSGHILEGNAGPGLLTNLLMKARFPRLRIYESDHGFLSDLHALKKKLKSDAKVFEHNLLRIRWMMNRDLEDNRERIKSALEGIEPKPWEDNDPVLRMFIILPHETFFVLQMHDLMMQGGIYSCGRPEYFAVIPAVNFNRLAVIGKSKFVYKAVLFNLLFDFCVLGKIPEAAILPWRYKRKLDLRELTEDDEDHMILVKVTAKKELYPYVKNNQLKSLLFFMKILIYKQGDNVVSALEKWAPGFGIKLLPLGYTIYTQCKSLTPQQVLELYNIFITSPEYAKESFHHLMEHDQMRSETVQEILDNRTSEDVDNASQTAGEETTTNTAPLPDQLREEHEGS